MSTNFKLRTRTWGCKATLESRDKSIVSMQKSRKVGNSKTTTTDLNMEDAFRLSRWRTLSQAKGSVWISQCLQVGSLMNARLNTRSLPAVMNKCKWLWNERIRRGALWLVGKKSAWVHISTPHTPAHNLSCLRLSTWSTSASLLSPYSSDLSTPRVRWWLRYYRCNQ